MIVKFKTSQVLDKEMGKDWRRHKHKSLNNTYPYVSHMDDFLGLVLEVSTAGEYRCFHKRGGCSFIVFPFMWYPNISYVDFFESL